MLLGSSVCIEGTGVMVRTGAQGSQSGPNIFCCCSINPGSTEMLRGSRWQHRDAAWQ